MYLPQLPSAEETLCGISRVYDTHFGTAIYHRECRNPLQSGEDGSIPAKENDRLKDDSAFLFLPVGVLL